MFYRRRCWVLVAALALPCIFVAQTSRSQSGVAVLLAPTPGMLPQVSPVVPLTSVPVPYDPLELVTSGAQLVQSAEERAATMELLAKAHRLSNVRLHPYELKTSFISYGSSSSDGRWILDDMSPSGNVYRWTAQGPSFSGIFLNSNKLLSSNQPGGAMPLRLAQVRDAMWSVYFPEIGPHATLRTASGYLNGAELRCVLVAHGLYGKVQPVFSSGRSFDESEYCANPQTGLLETYSPYAGIYVHFEYANALHFHEQIIPDGFVVTEHGKTVIEDKTESVADAAPKDSSLFESEGLNPLGVGQAIVAPMMVRGFQTSQLLDASARGQVVVVHGMLSPDGQLTEAEVVASTDQSLDQEAVNHAGKAHALQTGTATQPGATPQSREIVFTVQFAPRLAPQPSSTVFPQ